MVLIRELFCEHRAAFQISCSSTIIGVAGNITRKK